MKCQGQTIAGALGLVLLAGCATMGRVEQMPRDMPAYDASVRIAAHARVALYSDGLTEPGLARRLKEAGCEVVSFAPTVGASRPEWIVEQLRCSQNTEWSGRAVSLVTVLVFRVRQPGRTAKNASELSMPKGSRSFQAVSRLPLGERTFNDERITQAERSAGIELALDNLMRIRAFGEALGAH